VTMRFAQIMQVFVVSLAIGNIQICIAATRPVTADDCVQVKYPSFYDKNTNNGDYGTIRISPAGDRVAYLLKVPILSRNENSYELYVKDLSDASRLNGRLFAKGDYISFQRGERFGVFFHLGAISFLKFCPFGGVMTEPLSKLCRGRNILQPEINTGFLSAQAAWPKSIDENAFAVTRASGLVHSFDLDAHVNLPLLSPVAARHP